MEKCNTEKLYVLHRQRLLNLILSKVEDSQKAEDLLHDSFMKLETCCENGCVCEKPKSYLFKTALNIVFDYIKKRRKKIIGLGEGIASQEVQASTPEKEDGCDLISCLNTFLEDTSEENRMAFEQVDLLQLPQVQVAEELGLALPTLKSRVQRTRKFLRNRLVNCCPDYKEKCI